MRIKKHGLRVAVTGTVVAVVVALLGGLGSTAAIAKTPAAGSSNNAAAVTAAKKKHAKKHAKAKKKHAKKKKEGSTAMKGLGVGPKEKGSSKAIESASEIPLAPAWTPEQLNDEPSGNWITSEGGTTGDHYSQLNEITTSNAAGLKSDWMTQLDGSAEAPKYSGEAPPVEYKGVIYYPTGADDIFAVSVASGKILWVHPGELSETVGDVCCGWDNRGVTIGDGMVFSSVLSGSVEALSQKTGKLVWKTELGEPSEGFTVTSAPLYYKGMVFLGPVGSEYDVRGFMEAFNAKTGALVWKHYNIPGPGEPGHTTWPTDTSCAQCNGEWENGGATTWNAPTVNDKLGLIYYSTANAGGDLQGATREGEDLWTVSMLALNYKTGKQAWGYQEVHHDVWDYDASQQPLMINVKIGGKTVEGIVQANKDGYAYFVNDKTGKPVFPIEEKPVPVSAVDGSYPTQPIPTMPPFDPLKASPETMAELQQQADEAAARKGLAAPTVVHGGYEGDDVFTAWGLQTEPTLQMGSGGEGGDREAPSSYDPKTGDYYVCATLDMWGVGLTGEVQVPKEGEIFVGGLLTGIFASQAANSVNSHGYLTAYDMHTGKIIWQDEWPHQCYSGNTTTDGGLLFVGNDEGEELSYDAATGQELWHWDLGAGGGPASVYEFDGEERVAVYAGGNDDGDTEHGDNLWQFSLKGTGPAGIELGKTPPPSERLP